MMRNSTSGELSEIVGSSHQNVKQLLLKLEKKASRRVRLTRNNINLRFVENIVRFVIIFLAVEWVVMSSSITQSFGKVLFQGTTVIAAVAGFAGVVATAGAAGATGAFANGFFTGAACFC